MSQLVLVLHGLPAIPLGLPLPIPPDLVLPPLLLPLLRFLSSHKTEKKDRRHQFPVTEKKEKDPL